MIRRTIAWTFFTVACTTALMTTGDAAGVVELRLHGRYFAEPATVHVTIAIEPDVQNRTLLIEADSDAMFRASEITLDGANERRIHNIEFKNLPAGNYILRAEVRSSTESRGKATQELVVTGSGAR